VKSDTSEGSRVKRLKGLNSIWSGSSEGVKFLHYYWGKLFQEGDGLTRKVREGDAEKSRRRRNMMVGQDPRKKGLKGKRDSCIWQGV